MNDRNPDSWDRIQSVLERALELPPEEIAGFLDGECAGDAELRAEVESLIAADRAAPAFLDRPAFQVGAERGPAAASIEGAQLGAYRVLREIGRGGMSVVYLGERADAQFEQRVAIKVLLRDASVKGLAERFNTERQILGSLDHRGIVRILDGGVTPDARPYLVMEYIEGERIDVSCDRRRLTIEERLSLFRQVLEAVAYAHRGLVVHRDLKPDNIMVTADGDVRLLDFGIAKLLDADAVSATPTRTGVRPMTPEYASPEQIRGERITTACDIYALGVLLFELLTGRRPHAEATTPWAVERAVLESEPARPSDAVRRPTHPSDAQPTAPEAIAAARRTEPIRLSATLDGDLDAIVLKALRKEPEERYGSADAFRDDVERYLGSLPVLARRGSRLYRVRKFVRRHRAGVALGAGTALLVVAATAAIAASRVSAERARDRAEREARTAREVTDFLIGVFGGSDPYQSAGDSVSARMLLQQGRERIGRELLDEPFVRASLLDAIGRVYSRLGRYEIADTLLMEAAQLRTDLLGPDDVAVAETFQALGENRLYWRDHPAAIEHLERALRIHNSLATDSGVARASVLTDLATSLRELGNADSARALIDQALAFDRMRHDSTSLGHFDRLIGSAATLRALEDYDSATRVYDDLLPRLRQTLSEEHPVYSTALNNAAFLLVRQERWADAVPLYRQSIAISVRTLGPDHPRVQTLRSNLAVALHFSGAPDEAIVELRERLESTRRMWPDGHWRVGSSHQGLGKALLLMNRHAEAEAALRDAVASFTATIGTDNTWTLVAETWVVLAMTLQGDERGIPLLDRALTRLDGAPLDGDTRADITRIADQLEAFGLTQKAEAFRVLLEAAQS
jgi:serine/threonine-protein kinase